MQSAPEAITYCLTATIHAGTAGCTTQLDSSAQMVGARWLPSFQIYTQVCAASKRLSLQC